MRRASGTRKKVRAVSARIVGQKELAAGSLELSRSSV
jgi:hypothetical protein